MSVVILGGNECMERRYKELCQTYRCQAKVFTKPAGGLRNKLGSPDLIVLPGTKNTIGDMKWLRQNGLEAVIKKLASRGTPSAAAVSSDAKYRVTCSSSSTDTGWATMPLLS